MTAQTHTLGPWEWRHYGADCTALVGAPALGSSVPQAVNLSSGHPDARLIAAAPELLEALEEARAELEGFAAEFLGENYNNLKINAAIAKARGDA